MDELNIKEAPSAARHAGGKKAAIFWAIVFVLALGAIGAWLLAPPQERARMREVAANAMDDLTRDTPVAGLGRIIRESPAPLPETVLKPQTEEGTLAGRQVTGIIGSPVEVGERQISPSAISAHELIERLTSPPDTPVFSSEPLPPVTEDREIKPDYLSRMADWLASRYRPGEAGGSLAMNVQALNNFCGVTLAGEAKGGRQGLLRYAFHPGMIEALYNLYVNRFLADLDSAARRKGLNDRQNRFFHRAVAGKAQLAANSISGAMAVKELGKRLAAIDAMGQKVVDLNAQLGAAVTDLDALRASDSAASQLSTARMRVDGLAARYRRAMGEHAEAQRALAAEIRRNAGTALDDDSLLFIAAWVERRVEHESGARNAINSCVTVLKDLARRCNVPDADIETR